MARRKWKWTPLQKSRLEKVIEILDELADYIPLTLRQIYYQLVAKAYIENTRSMYNGLSGLLKWARIDGYISWDAIEDRVRAFHNLSGWRDKSQFLEQRLEAFLASYDRNVWQTQDRYVEVWIEKDALSGIFTRVCSRYGVSVVVCRGFSSVSYLHEFKKRLVTQGDKDRIMLYFGDFDPSGVEMLKSMEITLRDELGVVGIEFERIALLRDDIFTYRLPHDPTALKKTDTRAKKHLEAYGELAVELDALRPDVLEEKIEGAVRTEITDVDAFNEQVGLYSGEVEELKDLKERIVSII
jgi:hypothetical protein